MVTSAVNDRSKTSRSIVARKYGLGEAAWSAEYLVECAGDSGARDGRMRVNDDNVQGSNDSSDNRYKAEAK